MIKTAEICICDICAHPWLPETMPPARCAKCKTPRWNQAEGLRAATPKLDGIQAESGKAQTERIKREAPQQANMSTLRQAKLCEHGAVPSLCKFAKCRKT